MPKICLSHQPYRNRFLLQKSPVSFKAHTCSKAANMSCCAFAAVHAIANVLQHVLQCVVVRGSVLQCVAVRLSAAPVMPRFCASSRTIHL